MNTFAKRFFNIRLLISFRAVTSLWPPLFFAVFIGPGDIPYNFSDCGRCDQGLHKQHVNCFNR